MSNDINPDKDLSRNKTHFIIDGACHDIHYFSIHLKTLQDSQDKRVLSEQTVSHPHLKELDCERRRRGEEGRECLRVII